MQVIDLYNIIDSNYNIFFKNDNYKNGLLVTKSSDNFRPVHFNISYIHDNRLIRISIDRYSKLSTKSNPKSPKEDDIYSYTITFNRDNRSETFVYTIPQNYIDDLISIFRDMKIELTLNECE